MKKKIVVVGLCLCLLATVAMGDITNSSHNFETVAGGAFNLFGGEICKACHTPHNAFNPNIYAPFWDRTDSVVDPYTLYSSTTTEPNLPTTVTLTGVTKLCMSCHDSSVNIDAIGGAGGSVAFGNTDEGHITVDSTTDDLSAMHPVGFTYNTGLTSTDGELHDPATVNTAGLLESYTSPTALQGSGENLVTCISCHDVHDSADQADMLRMDNTGSALCLTCHNK